MAALFSGTSGFAYPAWKPDFYPKEVPAKKFLQYYAGRLNAVEINYTFRRLPSAEALASWVESTPPRFVFALKGHMRITHIQRLKKSEFTEVFFRAVDPLRSAGRLGPILFQLPPAMKCDAAVLREFVSGLPRDIRIAFEFRHISWLNPEVYGILQEAGASLCLAESEKLTIPEVITANFVYARLRKDGYSEEERLEIAARAKAQLAKGNDMYVFFKHEDTPAGALYAEELLNRGCPPRAKFY